MTSALKSWRERLATPLKTSDQTPGEGDRPQTQKTTQTSNSLRVGLRTPDSANRTQTPIDNDPLLHVRSDVRNGPRLVRTGPNTWIEAEWARGLCVMCPEPLKEGDVIACVEHRRQMDALEMPWDRQP